MKSELPQYERFDTAKLIELSCALGWLSVSDSGIAVLAPAGERVFSIVAEHLRMRRGLLDYVEVFRPPWIRMTLDGRMRVLAFAPLEIRQSLVEAYLAFGYDANVIEFWDQLVAIARGQQSIELSLIGREGERLTLGYEKHRTGREPQWRSIESNSDGFDVLSVASREDSRSLPIEVKASRMGLAGTIHLTRNEWESTELLPRHQLHLWDLSQGCIPRLAIVTRAEVAPHIPSNCGSGKWREVEIDFAVFQSKFSIAATR
jgi:Domain of unknown function (DUF3883)